MRRYLPQTGLVDWLKRWPCGRTVPLVGYAAVVVICLILCFQALGDGPGPVAEKKVDLFVPFIHLEGSSPLEPLFSLVIAIAGVALFDALARALKAGADAAANTAAPVEADADA